MLVCPFGGKWAQNLTQKPLLPYSWKIWHLPSLAEFTSLNLGCEHECVCLCVCIPVCSCECLCFPQTVGVLTVAEASVSGVFRCVASNSAGSDQLDLHFYVTGDPVQDESSPLKYTLWGFLFLSTSGIFFFSKAEIRNYIKKKSILSSPSPFHTLLAFLTLSYFINMTLGCSADPLNALPLSVWQLASILIFYQVVKYSKCISSVWSRIRALKFPFPEKHAFLLDTTFDCCSFTKHYDLCAQAATIRLFSQSILKV